MTSISNLTPADALGFTIHRRRRRRRLFPFGHTLGKHIRHQKNPNESALFCLNARTMVPPVPLCVCVCVASKNEFYNVAACVLYTIHGFEDEEYVFLLPASVLRKTNKKKFGHEKAKAKSKIINFRFHFHQAIKSKSTATGRAGMANGKYELERALILAPNISTIHVGVRVCAYLWRRLLDPSWSGVRAAHTTQPSVNDACKYIKSEWI